MLQYMRVLLSAHVHVTDGNSNALFITMVKQALKKVFFSRSLSFTHTREHTNKNTSSQPVTPNWSKIYLHLHLFLSSRQRVLPLTEKWRRVC